MSNETNQNRKPKPPTHVIYQVIGEKDKARWIRCGAAWQNADGKGLTLKFDAFPVAGRTVIREVAEKVDAEKGGRQ